MPISRALFSIFLLAAVFCTSQLFAQKADFKKLDQFLSHLTDNDQFMGSVAIYKEGKPLFSKAYGVYAYENGKPLKSTPETKYRIGSITKTFTSVMIMQLVEEGRVSLDDKLSKYFDSPENADTITIDDLLRHRSGLGSITSQPGYLSWSKSPKTRQEMMEKILACPTEFEPDAKTEYSNTNFLLLGYIVEDVTGNSYADELQTRIVKPLGMKNTYFGNKIVAAENEAASFAFRASKWMPESETDMSIPAGAGSIVSTPGDLAVFFNALFTDKLVKPKSLETMSDVSTGMGYGLMKFPFNDKSAMGHGGAIDGFLANAAYIEGDKISVAVCGNGIVYNFNDVLIGVLSHTYGLSHDLPSFETVEVAAGLLKRYEGVYGSKDFPLKITIAVSDDKLTAQATGQDAFPMVGTSETDFKFDPAGIQISFTESSKGKGYDGFKFQQRSMGLKFKKIK